MAKNQKIELFFQEGKALKTIWFDLTNTPHVHFFKPFIKKYATHARVIISMRDFSETIKFAQLEFDLEPLIIGKHGGRKKIRKVYNVLSRIMQMSRRITNFDIALSCGGVEASFIAKMRRKIAITFDDNDISPNWMYSHFVDYAFFPRVIQKAILLKQGFKYSSIIQYSGYKEDIYVADYKPDENFLKNLPFKDYVLVRPENFMASYLKKDCQSIVPELLNILSGNGSNVLYLPRYEFEQKYARGISGVYIPEVPVNGLDAAFFSRAVLSGAGSLTREAACLGRPAVSFYAGDKLLAVDQQMIKDGWIFHTRNPKEIDKYLKNARPRAYSIERSQKVQREVFNKLDEILSN